MDGVLPVFVEPAVSDLGKEFIKGHHKEVIAVGFVPVANALVLETGCSVGDLILVVDFFHAEVVVA